MKFFKRKPKLTTMTKKAAKAAGDAGEATLCEIELPETVEQALADSKKGAALTEETLAKAAGGIVPAEMAAVHLFPGFDGEAFDLAYGATAEATHGMGASTPVLMMRWKGETNWFTLPPMFNTAIISKISERESEKDLNRLLRDSGYDVEGIAGRK